MGYQLDYGQKKAEGVDKPISSNTVKWLTLDKDHQIRLEWKAAGLAAYLLNLFKKKPWELENNY